MTQETTKPTLNRYEERQANRKARYEELAQANSAESMNVYRRAKGMLDCIPPGQPILVGHHSEKRDRGFRARMSDNMRKSIALEEKAQHYTQKAAAVGTGGISSDDPAAIDKLQNELAAREARQEKMKLANKVIRSCSSNKERKEALINKGFSEEEALKILSPNCFEDIGFARFELTNNNANIRRLKIRIEDLKKRRQRATSEVVGKGYTYKEDTEENRVMFFFEGKPDEEIRQLLKSRGFKWSPTRGAWVRQLNNAGLWAGEVVRKTLDTKALATE